MSDQLRDAATRAAVWGVIAAAAKDRQDEAKAELRQLEPGDTIAAKVNGQLVGKATMANGRAKLVVTDESQLLAFIRDNHPTELVQSVNPAYLKALEAKAKEVGAVIDDQGEFVPGVELVAGAPYVSVRRDKEAPFIVAQLLSSGQVQLDGIKQIEAAS